MPIHGKVGLYICCMRQKTYNIRYFHGLDSFLSEEKRTILEKFGKVTAPVFNYKDVAQLHLIADSFDEILPDTILIGSSFGGYIASINSAAYDIPCLLFNPALKYREQEKVLDEPFADNIGSPSYIVLGRKDEVINCEDNLNLVNKYFKSNTKIFFEEEMGHRIPVDIFQKHVESFFKQIYGYA